VTRDGCHGGNRDEVYYRERPSSMRVREALSRQHDENVYLAK
jgi:hypothetical protein